ncbi:RCC1/BLIP-II [Tilletiaria anomala UBC 951]|uniref:RCC1/BLIP-II n=1 Tax=Tilletiaria anomala (strain ATCC 24038 / CBS 436.72 / UBC 951) TaxID=1037660 RepID=A0A066W8M7_TILAU|nr:RCC1/BLIP-II [Tilletiaria anomala UBC 951]KDN48858.1 RCC1/BLIP-II [Tilletiaria anomala UBC 951]
MQRQRLLWAGSVLDRVSPYLQEVPKDWLAGIGIVQDADADIRFTHLAGSVSHSLLAYRTVPGAFSSSEEKAKSKENRATTIKDSGDQAPALKDEGHAKIIAIGRNTHGQLGLGFTSQESSWGMVQSDFEGKRIKSLHAANGSSFIVMELEDGSSALYAMGNHTSGQLGLGMLEEGARAAKADSGDAQLSLFPAPERVRIMSTAEGPGRLRIISVATGLDHVLILCEFPGHCFVERVILSSGINTDGQLGIKSATTRFRTHTLRRIDSSLFKLKDGDQIAGIAAGGDTSFAWSDSGRVWSWGNSEYGQAAHGKAIDRIDEPLEATEHLRSAGVKQVKHISAGGSFTTILDASGILFTVGYGPIGQGKDTIQALNPTPLPLPSVRFVASGLEYAAAVTEEGKLLAWGLDTMASRLAIDPPSRKPWPSFMRASRFTPDFSRSIDGDPADSPAFDATQSGGLQGMLRVYKPTHVHAKVKLENWDITDVACSGETLWVLAEDGKEPMGVWDTK